MALNRSINIIKRIDFLVRMRSTGSARELGAKLGVSRRSAYNYLKELKDLGTPLSWSVDDHSYTYPEGYQMLLEFEGVTKSDNNIKPDRQGE